MRDNSFVRFFVISLFLFLGLIIGVLLVPTLEGNGTSFIFSIVVILVVVGFIIVMRTSLLRPRKILKTSKADKEGSEVGFVVETFHDLVEKLKEKERELEKLRACAEEKAIRMEAYNENILQSVPSGVISIDNAMKIKSVNQAAEYILGVDSRETIGRNFDEIFNEPLTKLVTDDKTILRGEYPYVTNDRRHIWLGITSSQLKNAAGEIIGLIFVFTDLTDIKALQSQVELKERLSQLGEMSAGISHELRNSMSVISGYAKLLCKKVESSNKSTVDAILTEINSMDKIISELLAFAKPTVLNTGQVDLSEMIKESAATAVGDNNTIEVSINAVNYMSIKADEILLRQALINLFINAVEAMPEGGRLGIELSYLNDKAAITVQDTGYGIPKDLIQRIFLPFHTTKEKGTGLGLALVQKVIISHGGSIDVDSKEGEGTTFRVVLPAEK